MKQAAAPPRPGCAWIRCRQEVQRGTPCAALDTEAESWLSVRAAACACASASACCSHRAEEGRAAGLDWRGAAGTPVCLGCPMAGGGSSFRASDQSHMQPAGAPTGSILHQRHRVQGAEGVQAERLAPPAGGGATQARPLHAEPGVGVRGAGCTGSTGSTSTHLLQLDQGVAQAPRLACQVLCRLRGRPAPGQRQQPAEPAAGAGGQCAAHLRSCSSPGLSPAWPRAGSSASWAVCWLWRSARACSTAAPLHRLPTALPCRAREHSAASSAFLACCAWPAGQPLTLGQSQEADRGCRSWRWWARVAISAGGQAGTQSSGDTFQVVQPALHLRRLAGAQLSLVVACAAEGQVPLEAADLGVLFLQRAPHR